MWSGLDRVRLGAVDTAHITMQDIAGEFPRWDTWIGIAGICYAKRRKTSPPAVVRGEDPAVLLAEIRDWENSHVR